MHAQQLKRKCRNFALQGPMFVTSHQMMKPKRQWGSTLSTPEPVAQLHNKVFVKGAPLPESVS
jgi:hypothetical protein